MVKCRPITLDGYLKKMSIDYKGNKSGKGIKKDPKRMTAEEYIKTRHPKTYKIKIKLFEDGIREEKCEICNLTDWQGKTIPTELHHIDGDRFNNGFENLQVLCPNCHAQTENYRSKNIKK